MNERETLLRVEHLKQYFKDGKTDFKAVDDVSFEIKKGEIFGLVGESGCGKTTTGRSIIKLYNITGGNVYFKGERISAGIRDYQDTIRDCRAQLKTASPEQKAELQQTIAEQKKTDVRSHPRQQKVQDRYGYSDDFSGSDCLLKSTYDGR